MRRYLIKHGDDGFELPRRRPLFDPPASPPASWIQQSAIMLRSLLSWVQLPLRG
jgi:hypothetical protein